MARLISTRPPGERSPVAFAGGGTAGHVFPGLAVARALAVPVLWIGEKAGIEQRLAAEAGVDFRGIPAGKLRRYLSLRNLTDVARTLAGVAASVRILARERPSLLFSKGGFVSVPPVLAARLLGIPAWTHESDWDPGLATRINVRFCEKVLVSFPETVGFLPPSARGKTVVTGNPVRSVLHEADAARGRAFAGAPAGVPLLLVLGGSQASAAVNALVAGALETLCAAAVVVHQFGESGELPPRRPRYLPLPFIGRELPDLMAAADLVITRAGANTLAEIAVLGRPSLLVPLPSSSSRGDQLRNAEVFQRAGAALTVREETASPAGLAREVLGLLADPPRLRAMSTAARGLSSGRAAETIAALIRERVG